MLLLLLLFPILVGLAVFFFGKGRTVTIPEFIVQEVVIIIIIASGYYLALSSKSSDTELWNGVIARKWQDTQSCCHSYPCNCHEVCSGSGEDRSCSEICDTCYEHSNDISWEAISSNQELVFSDRCNSPSSSPPERWNQIIVGEPTAVEHSYTNYIKGNPDSILRRQGYEEKYKGRIPRYPKVYDHYRAERFLVLGLSVPDRRETSAKLNALNGEFGAAKQVDIILILTNMDDPEYAEAVREAWLGGKKNDVVIVVGAPSFPKLSWVSVLSWSKSEDMKIAIRDKLLAMPTWSGSEALKIIRHEVGNRFVRRRWQDFDYLKSTIEPSVSMQWTLGIVGVLLSIGLSFYFWIFDPFGPGTSSFYIRRSRNAFTRRY